MATNLSPATPTIADLSSTPLACPRCGTATAATARFCAACGYALFTPPPVPPKRGYIMAPLRVVKRILAAFMRFLGRLFASITAGALMWVAVVSLLARFDVDEKDSEVTLGTAPFMYRVGLFLWLGLAAIFTWPRLWGTSPRLTCPRCGARSQTTARFCHACAQTLVARAPEATKRSSLGKALGGVGRLLGALSGAALAFVLLVAAIYYLRLDTQVGIWLLILPLLLASVTCVVLVARPKTYGALLRTRRRSLVTGFVVVSTVVGLSALPDRDALFGTPSLPAALTAAGDIARGLPVVTFNFRSPSGGPPNAPVVLIGIPLGDGNVLVDADLTGAEAIEITEAGTTRRATLIDVFMRESLLKTTQGNELNDRGLGIGEPPPPDTEVLGVTYDRGAIRVAPVRVTGAVATGVSTPYFAIRPAPTLPRNNSGLLLDRSGMVVGMVREWFGWNRALDLSVARSWVPQAVARVARANEITNFIRPLVSSWRPSGTTILTLDQNVLTASTLTREPPIRLAVLSLGSFAIAGQAGALGCTSCFGDLTNWSMRRDGAALVVSVEVGYDTARLAIWEPGNGKMRWLTDSEPGVRDIGPVWSPDGGAIYFARIGPSTTLGDLVTALYRINQDGTHLKRVAVNYSVGVHIPLAASIERLYVRHVTDENWGLAVVDVATGGISEPWNEYSTTDAIRVVQPSALIQGLCHGMWCAGPSDQRSCGTEFCNSPRRLAVFDERTGDLTELVDDSMQVLGADWDPSGTRIVAASRATSSQEPSVLQTMDEAGGARRTIADTAWAMDPHWLPEGILYLWSASAEWRDQRFPGTSPSVVPIMRGPFELRLVDPSTAVSRTVVESESAFRFVIVGN